VLFLVEEEAEGGLDVVEGNVLGGVTVYYARFAHS
jgi:hypothetical protein